MRRAIKQLGAALAIGLAVCAWSVAGAQALDPSDPSSIPKYQEELVIPPAMPVTSTPVLPGVGPIDYYEIAVRQLEQRILPTGFPATKVWSYGSVTHPGTFNYPAFTIEARFKRPVRVKWINELVEDPAGCFHPPNPSSTACNYLPHLLPVDQTLHWANPLGGVEGRDMRPSFTGMTPGYTGPVPMVPHLHGGHSAQESDGYAEAWFLPAASNLPADTATEGTWYDFFKGEFGRKFGVVWEAGTATFQYENDQRASTLWYHDHSLGMTRLNVYAGPAGFYLLRRGPGDLPPNALPGPAPAVGSDPFDTFYEVPIAIQDRSFHSDGSLAYPASRTEFDGFAGPYIPFSDISPIWNPEFFGNTIVVNGRTWPYLEVEPRRYRFRFLNGCNSRFLILKLASDPVARPAAAALPFWQIGGEGGFLPAPVMLESLLMGLAERADVVVDFTGLEVGTELFLINEAPDEPFGGGVPGDDFDYANPGTTGQVMKFKVVPLASRDTSLPLDRIRLPAVVPLGRASNTRRVSLNEVDSEILEDVGPAEALLGTMDGDQQIPLGWDDPITEAPALGSIEIWEMFNFTADAHPIHIHEVQFQVVDRQPFEVEEGELELGDPRPPEPWETGFKDTVISYPGEITRVKAKFDLPGLYVWHCHIVEHEDNEMMRPYCVGGCPLPPQ